MGLSAGSFSPYSGGTVPDLHRIPSPLAVSGAPYHPRVRASRLLLTWLPVVLWAGLIFTLSTIPDLSTGIGGWDTVLRKLAHIAEYAILGALLLRAIRRGLPAFVAGVAYAITDEIHQHFVTGRHGSPVDVAIDAVGVLAGIVALSFVHR